MSAIRISHGSAEITVTSDDFEYNDGTRSTRYLAADLMAAVVTVLRAMPDAPPRYLTTSPSDEWLAAIEKGAASQGLEMPS